MTIQKDHSAAFSFSLSFPTPPPETHICY